MEEKGMKAVYVGDVSCNEEDAVCGGKYELVFLSPESLRSRTWRDMLESDVYQENLVAFIVDEAHCVKKWSVNCFTIIMK